MCLILLIIIQDFFCGDFKADKNATRHPHHNMCILYEIKNRSLECVLANKNEKNNAILRKTVRRGRREANSSTVTFLWTVVAYSLGL